MQKHPGKRSFRNMRFLPDSRLRLSFAAIAACSLAATFCALSIGHQLRDLIPDQPAVLATYSTAALSLAAAIASLYLGGFVSHRIYGPLVALKRLLGKLRDGDYAARGRLRPGDELQDLMHALNELAAELEKRHPKG